MHDEDSKPINFSICALTLGVVTLIIGIMVVVSIYVYTNVHINTYKCVKYNNIYSNEQMQKCINKVDSTK
jgi:multidrug efflux pump subunit AcrB